MQGTVWPRLAVGVCVLALAVALSACGKGDKDGDKDKAAANGDQDKTAAKGAGTKDTEADPKGDEAVKKPAELPIKNDGPVKYCGADPCPCADGSEEKHYETELMRKCTLTKEMDVQGYPVRADAEVTFDKEGKLIFFYLGKDFDIGGYLGKSQANVALRSDGSLKTISLAEQKEISGVPCINGTDFYQGGALRRCEVAAEAELSGHKVQAGDWITLDPNGKLHRWEIESRVQKIGKYECTGYMNYVHPTGELLRCGFAKDTKVGGKKYKKDDFVCFDTAGKASECDVFEFDVGGD